MLDLSADQWRINEFSLRETFDNNPILSVTRRAAHINNKQMCVYYIYPTKTSMSGNEANERLVQTNGDN